MAAPTRWLRVRLLAALVVPLGLVVLLASGRAQPPGFPRPPGSPGMPGGPGVPGGFRGGVPGGPGAGFSGVRPGMPGGPGGGMVGTPRPGVPEMPRPGMPPDMSGGGISGMPGGPGTVGRIPRPGGSTSVIEYRCSRCNAFLGTGAAGAAVMVCPSCGAHFNGTIIHGREPGATPPPVSPPSPSAPPPPEFPQPTFTPPDQYQPVLSTDPAAAAPRSAVNWSRAGFAFGILSVVGVACIIALFVAGFIYRQTRNARRFRRYY